MKIKLFQKFVKYFNEIYFISAKSSNLSLKDSRKNIDELFNVNDKDEDVPTKLKLIYLVSTI